MRNIIGAGAARALKKHPIKLYRLEMNINHEQSGTAPIDGTKESLTNVVGFKQTFHRLVATKSRRPAGDERSRNGENRPSRSTEQQALFGIGIGKKVASFIQYNVP